MGHMVKVEPTVLEQKPSDRKRDIKEDGKVCALSKWKYRDATNRDGETEGGTDFREDIKNLVLNILSLESLLDITREAEQAVAFRSLELGGRGELRLEVWELSVYQIILNP